MANEARVFQQGETAQAFVEVKNQAGALVVPTSVKLDLWDPALAQKVTAQTFDSTSVPGEYTYDFLTTTDHVTGWWSAKVTIADSAVITIAEGGFELK